MIGFVIMRDRVTYARQCVAALEAAGLDVVIVDHGSTWPEAVRWMDGVDEQSNTYGGFPRVDWRKNRHPRDLWQEREEDRPGILGPIRAYVTPGSGFPRPGTRFVVTDCDVVPDDRCPKRWVEAMGKILDDNPHVVKVGLGLRTDDLPEHYVHRDKVIEWEAQWQSVYDGGRAPFTVTAGAGVLADIDTTLAMYRYLEPFQLGPAVRMRNPFLARHLPWYENSANPTPEQAYYAAHAEHGHWRAPDGFNDDHALEAD